MKKGKVLIGIGAALLCVIGIAAGVSAAMGRGFTPLGLLSGFRGTTAPGTLPLVIEITRPVSGDSGQAAPVTEAVTPEPLATTIPVTEALTTEAAPATETEKREETTEVESSEETEETAEEETTEAETWEEETTDEETTEAETPEETTEEESTEETTTPEATTPAPTTPEPATPAPTTPEPTTPAPTTPEPTTPEPTTPEPTTAEPATQAQETVPEELRQHLAALDMEAEQLVGTQLLVVKGLETPKCLVYAYEKTEAGWRPVEWLSGIPGIMGRDGMAWHTPENAKYTPIGYFGLGPAYGEAEWEDTALEYHQIQSEDYWVLDPDSKYYNKLYKTHYGDKDWEHAEEMIALLEYYALCIYVQKNVNPVVYNEGSAIFVHIDRLDNSTSGCIGVERWVMEALFKWMRADADPHIFLYPGQ